MERLPSVLAYLKLLNRFSLHRYKPVYFKYITIFSGKFRYLPDKELRYRRTVIVTAAVYWSFTSEHHSKRIWKAPIHLTYQHWAGVSPYT